MIYTIHLPRDARPPFNHESGDAWIDGLVAIPDGKAKWALLFPPFWLGFHRLWWALAFYTLIAVLVFALLATPWFPIALLLGGLPGIYLFLEGHQLRRNRLERDGYDMVGVVDARDETIAIHRYLAEGNLPEPRASTPERNLANPLKPLRRTGSQSIGLFAEREF